MSVNKSEGQVLIIGKDQVSDGLRHRLIVSHMPMVEAIAAEFRGAKGIPFDDLLSEGALGLLMAANNADKARNFTEFAAACIRNMIKKFILGWQPVVSGTPETMPEREFWEWQIWAYAAPYEQWNSLLATPEEIVSRFNELGAVKSAILSAMIGIDNRSRGIFNARFFRNPQQDLQSIAREYQVSYSFVVRTIKRVLMTIRDKLETKKTA